MIVAAVGVWPAELDVWLTGAAACTCRSERRVVRFDLIAGVGEELWQALWVAANTASEGAQNSISSPPSL